MRQADELWRFLEMTAEGPCGPLWRLVAFTGLRRGEFCGLRWVDVDLEGEHPGITIRQTVLALAALQACPVCHRQHRGCFIKSSAKSDAGARWVPLVAEAVAALREQRQLQEKNRRVWGEGYSPTTTWCSLRRTAVRSTPAR